MKSSTGSHMRMESTATEQTNSTANKPSENECFTFNEHLSKGSDALSQGALETAELHYSSALKLIWQEEKKNEMGLCFEGLGNIYMEYGKQSKSGEDFTKATALYNAALARLTSSETERQKQLISLIKETEKLFLNTILGEDAPINFCNYEMDMKHKALLEKIRDNCKEKISQVDVDCDPGLMPLNSEERVALEKRRTNLVSTIFRKISEDMASFVRMLIEECTSVLGNAPCRFAVIGLGSLARNEMTPYSDLEFAILLEEGANTEANLAYFRNITFYLHLKVLNLGETILPSMAITSLNDFYSGVPTRMWFVDDGPRGFCFDGAMPWASKSPHGRKQTQTKESLELIRTPEEMAALQSEQLAVKEGYHLADVLATSMLIAGDEELVKVYNVKVKERLQTPSSHESWTNGSKRGFDCLYETFQDFSVNLDWQEAGKVFNVKKELYRFPSLVLNSLTLYYNLDARNTWDVVEEMQRKQLITEEEAHNLSFVLAVASELRLRSYLGRDEQRERMTGLPAQMVEPDVMQSVATNRDVTKLEKVFHISNPDIIFRFFLTVLPLQKAIEEFLSENSPIKVNILANHNLYDDSLETKATIHFRLFELEKAKSCLESVFCRVEDELERGNLNEIPGLFETLSVLGNICLELGEVQQAVGYLDKAAQVLQVKYNGVTTNIEFARSYRDRGNAYALLGEYKKSLSFHQQDLSTKIAVYGEKSPAIDIAISFNGIARAYQQMKNIDQAIVYYEKSLEIIKEVGITRVTSYYCVALNNLLSAYAEHGDLQKAIDRYKELFETLTSLFGAGVLHPYLASSLSNLASAYHDVEDYKQAASLYEQSLSIRQRLYGRNEVHPEIAKLLHNLGQTYSSLSDYDRAVKYFTDALQMQKLIYGKQSPHPSIATTLSSLGSARLSQLGLTDALEAYDEALRILRIIHQDKFAHRDLCAVLNDLGYVHSELNRFDKAVEYLEEARKLWAEICTNDEPHEDFASCLNNLGNVYRNLAQYKKAYECCREGLEMRRLLSKESCKNAPLAKSFIDTGHCCTSLGDHDNALSFYKRALEMRKEINIDVAEAYNEVGNGYSSLGQPLEAIKCYKEVIRLDEEKYGVGNVPDSKLSTNLCNLGSEYIATEEYRKGAEMLEKALVIIKRILGDDVSLELAATLNNLGTVYRNLKDSKKALTYLEEALVVKTKLYGEGKPHLEIAKTLTNLGNVCSQRGEFQQAIEYFSRALDMKHVLFGPNTTHQSIAVTLGNIGNLHYQLGQYDLAVASIKDALRRFGDESCSREVALSLYNLGQAYEALHDLPAACGCYEKSAPIMIQVFGESHPLVRRVLVSLIRIRGLAQLQVQQANNSG